MLANGIYRFRCNHRTFQLLRTFCSKPPKDTEPPNSDDEKNKQTRKKMSDLLRGFKIEQNKTKTYNTPYEIPSRRETIENKKKEISEERQRFAEIEPQVKDAVKSVAKHIGGDTKKTESELADSVRTQRSITKKLKSTFLSMKIEKSPPPSGPSMKEYEMGRQNQRPVFGRHLRNVSLFGAEPLDILPDPNTIEEPCEEDMLETWRELHSREVNAAVTHFPRNEFEEIIQWTEEGKFWTFPIDNEFGLEEEKAVSFAEHIFLGRHIEDWCPKFGPIRHFMELICTGLSKNPYMTVERKKAHLEWYKDYFKEKAELLKEIEAI